MIDRRYVDELLSGKVALITGSASGIGLDCAKEMARNGAAVVVADIDYAAAEAAAASIVNEGREAYAVEVDLSARDSVESFDGGLNTHQPSLADVRAFSEG
jgi:3-hydroxybutyrate dehydrogenase